MVTRCQPMDLFTFSSGLVYKKSLAERMIAVFEFILAELPKCGQFQEVGEDTPYPNGQAEMLGVRLELIHTGGGMLKIEAWQTSSNNRLFWLMEGQMITVEELSAERPDILLDLFNCLEKLLQSLLETHPGIHWDVEAYQRIGLFMAR